MALGWFSLFIVYFMFRRFLNALSMSACMRVDDSSPSMIMWKMTVCVMWMSESNEIFIVSNYHRLFDRAEPCWSIWGQQKQQQKQKKNAVHGHHFEINEWNDLWHDENAYQWFSLGWIHSSNSLMGLSTELKKETHKYETNQLICVNISWYNVTTVPCSVSSSSAHPKCQSENKTHLTSL